MMLLPASSSAGQNGVALICVLMVTTLLGTLAAALLFVVMAESMTSGNHRVAEQVFYAADAAVERTIGDLRAAPDWRPVPGTAGTVVTSGFLGPEQGTRLPAGIVLDLARLTAQRQIESNTAYAASTDRPVWRLFGHAPPSVLFEQDIMSLPLYVIVWVADDVDDGDGDPLRDSNGVLEVRAEAFGPSGARRRIEVVLARREMIGVPAPDGEESGPAEGPAGVRVLSWREVR